VANNADRHDDAASNGIDLADELSDFARALAQESDPDATLERVTRGAIALIPGVEEGSITVVLRRRKVESHGASSELPRRADALQHEVGQGPCLDAAYEERTVRVDDMSAERRWPEFASAAAQLGVGSMLSFQLWVHDENLGALNLYASKPWAFDDESVHVGLIFAAHAAVALAGAQREENLERAVETRDLIGQAKGVLMERYRLDGDRAFAFLVRLSTTRNEKLRDVAGWIVADAEKKAHRAADDRRDAQDE
jgi:GAF domain-containing protein